jgi:hypothetical protein
MIITNIRYDLSPHPGMTLCKGAGIVNNNNLQHPVKFGKGKHPVFD